MNLRSRLVACAAFAIAGLAASAVHATVYDVNLAVGAGSIKGTITTDGTLGVLHFNITGFDLMVSDGTYSYDMNQGQYAQAGDEMTATKQGLFFNFADTHFGDEFNPLWLPGAYVTFNNSYFGQAYPSSIQLEVNGHPTQTQYETGNFEFATASVPEPATWALTLLGFAAVGAALRRGLRVAMA